MEQGGIKRRQENAEDPGSDEKDRDERRPRFQLFSMGEDRVDTSQPTCWATAASSPVVKLIQEADRNESKFLHKS